MTVIPFSVDDAVPAVSTPDPVAENGRQRYFSFHLDGTRFSGTTGRYKKKECLPR
jgi:hypothetical protein